MTYASLAAVFLTGAALAAAAAGWMLRLPRRWWHSTVTVALVLMLLTVVFDNLMIAADLFRFDDEALLGLRLFLVPIEDLAWPLAAALALPALWELLGRRRGRSGGPPGER